MIYNFENLLGRLISGQEFLVWVIE